LYIAIVLKKFAIVFIYYCNYVFTVYIIYLYNCTNNCPAGRRDKRREKYNWNRCDPVLFISTLCAQLSLIKMPYHLLQCSVPGPKAKLDLGFYYTEIVFGLKPAAKTAAPVERVCSGTRKPFWSINDGVFAAKKRARFWLRMWYACERPQAGTVFRLKQKTKKEYKLAVRNARLNGWDAPTDQK
jgi:hypothetical protein